jgi:hypothetical protein
MSAALGPPGNRIRPVQAPDGPRSSGGETSSSVESLRPGSDRGLRRAAALAYADIGWPVFPVHDMTTGACSCGVACDSPGKHPRTVSGFKDATTDREIIRAWWTRWPDANVAIATGAPGPDVLDVDIKPDGTGWPAFERLRRAGLLAGAARLCATRNGGAHLYFAGTDQRCSAIRTACVDFRAADGYVLAPPSMVAADGWAPHGTGRYELVWSRDSNARLDWEKCRALLVPAPSRAPMRPHGRLVDLDRLPGWLCDRLADGDPPDRSAAFHGLVSGCVFAGLDLAQTITILEGWPPGADKYGNRLSAEVERSWRKIAGGAA